MKESGHKGIILCGSEKVVDSISCLFEVLLIFMLTADSFCLYSLLLYMCTIM